MTTGLSSDSTLMGNDETVYIVRQPLAVPDAIAFVDGKPVRDPAQFEIIPCVGNVQPLSGKDLERLPDGDQQEDQLYVWTNNNATVLLIGDLMERQGIKYQCEAVDAWGNYSRGRFAADQTLAAYDPDADVSFLPDTVMP
jgi:hypothetical protein